MEYKDKMLTCEDCSKSFLFSGAEQAFFAMKHFQNEPRHCRYCRAKRGGVRGHALLRLTESRVACAQCGIETVVPFRPRKGLPVFCRECFERQLPERTVS